MTRLPFPVRVLMWLLPEAFREGHRDEMTHLLASYTKGRGRGVRALMWARATVDLVVVGVSLRARMLIRQRGEAAGMMDMIGQDVSFAVRALRRRPVFALVAVLTLAIGIGANTTIFSVVDGVLMEPLPYADADRIGILWHEFGNGAQNLPALHALDARDYRDRSELFEDLTIASGREWILGTTEDSEIVDVGVVEVGFFEFFGAAPELGRHFLPEEDVPGAAPVVVLSHRLWARRFGSDPGIVGRSIDVAGTTMPVVGVLPASFRLHLPAETFRLRDAEIWTTLRLDPARQPPRNFTGYTGFAKLRSGATWEQAQQELEVMEGQLRAEHPVHAASNLDVRVVPLLADVVKEVETVLALLLGAVGFVLLIACANVANLVIVRGHTRAHELSLRAALGARRSRLVRLALIESLVISVAGAGLGLLVAFGSLELLAMVGPDNVPRLDSASIDGTVLVFVAGVTVLSVALFGLAPALRSADRDPATVLNTDTRSATRRGGGRFRDGLVIGEVAASLVLLIGAGLMVRSFVALGSADPGYDVEGTLTFRISLPSGSFPEREDRIAFHDHLSEALLGLPGVERVAAIDQLPLTGSGALQPYAYDEETASNWESVTGDQRWVTPGFFDAIGARFVSGREFIEAEVGAGGSIIVDDRLAARAFPGEEAVGQRLQIEPNETPEEERYARIVGVVEHLRLHDVSRPHLTQIYFPMRGSTRYSVLVRTSADPAELVPAVRAELARLAPGAPLEDVRTMSDLVTASLASTRLALSLMTIFGVVALVLASVGLYGVLSYAVSQRTREIGVRMALGQAPSEVRRLVLVEGGRLVVMAVVLGLIMAVLLSGIAANLVYGVRPLDPATFLVTSLTLLAVGGLACWVPAHHATRVDPVIALRD